MPEVRLHATTPLAARSRRTTAVLAAVGAAVVVLDLGLHAAARWLGVDFEVVSFIGMREDTVDAGAVLVMTLVPWTLGSVLLLATRPVAARAWPWLAGLGGVLAVVTVPFFNEAGLDTKLALGLLHLTAGGAWIAAIRHLVYRPQAQRQAGEIAP